MSESRWVGILQPPWRLGVRQPIGSLYTRLAPSLPVSMLTTLGHCQLTATQTLPIIGR